MAKSFHRSNQEAKIWVLLLNPCVILVSEGWIVSQMIFSFGNPIREFENFEKPYATNRRRKRWTLSSVCVVVVPPDYKGLQYSFNQLDFFVMVS